MADSYTHRGYHDSLKQPKGSTSVADGCDHFRADSGISMSINEEFSSVPCLSTEGTELKPAVKDSQHRCVSVAYDSVITDSFDSCESKLKELQISESCSPHCASSCTTNTPATDLRNSVTESDPIAPSVSTPVPVLSLELLQELFSQDEDGDTKLHLAIIQPDAAAAMWMIAACALCRPTPLNIQNDKFRQTPLHMAVITNQPQIVRMLVISGALVDLRDHNGDTALHLACARGLLECVKALTLPVTQQEHVELSYYCQHVKLTCFAPPPFRAPDLGCLNYEGYSCLHLVQKEMRSNRIELIDYLVSRGANINIKDGKSGQSILHIAVKQLDVDLIRYLVCHRTLKINIKNYSKHTAFDVAHYLKFTEVRELLKLYGGVHSDVFLNGNDSNVDSSDDDLEDMMDDYDDISIGDQPLDVSTH